MNPNDPPRSTGKSPTDITITGKLFPWADGKPVLMQMPASPVFYLSLFDTETELRDMLKRANIPFESIKHVDDGPEFLDSLPMVWNGLPLVVITNPKFTERGTVKFMQVSR